MSNSRHIEEEMNLSCQEALEEYRGITKILSSTYALIAEDIFLNMPSVEGRVLDLGTGLGDLAFALSKKYPAAEIIGLDISSDALTIAQQRKEKEAVKNVSFRLLDVHKLDYADNSISLVVSHGSLHHWEDPAQALSQIQRILKKGGFGYIVDLSKDAPAGVVEEAVEMLNPAQQEGFLNSLRESYNISQLKALADEAGIDDFQVAPLVFSRQAIINCINLLRQDRKPKAGFNRLYLKIIIKK